MIKSPEDIIFFIKANDLALHKKLPKYMFISPTTEDILHANLGSMHNYLKFTQEVIICIKFKSGDAIFL